MKRRIQMAVGALLTLLLLWFLFRGTDWHAVWVAISNASLPWLLLSVAIIVASFFLRAQRWSYIVRTAGPVPYSAIFDATQIGFLANFVLPARAGEAVRAVVLAKLAQLPVTKCLAFGFLDRVTDLFGLLVTLSITALAYSPEQAVVLPEGYQLPTWAGGLLEPAAIRNGAALVALAIVGLTVAMVIVYLNTRLALRLSDTVLGWVSPKLAEKVHGLIQHFADGLHVLRSARALAGAVAFSLITWLAAALAIWAALEAFHIDGPWYTMFVVLGMTAIAISAPSTPGFVGAFHLGVMLGLFIAVDGIGVEVSKAFALITHLSNLVPIVVVGLYSLSRRRVGLFALQRDAVHIEEQ